MEAWTTALAELVEGPGRTSLLKIADVGTGTGEIALLLAGMGHEVQGFDIATGMLEHARAKPAPLRGAASFANGSAYTLPLAPASVDVVISRMVFWTLHDPGRALREWQRVLTPGGRIVVIDGLHFTSSDSVPQRIRRARTRAFWALEARVAGRNRRGVAVGQGRGTGEPEALQPPGASWSSADDARGQFAAAGLEPTSLRWLDEVHRAHRATAPVRWRMAGHLPRFFSITWEAS